MFKFIYSLSIATLKLTVLMKNPVGLNNWTEIVAEVEHSRPGTHMRAVDYYTK